MASLNSKIKVFGWRFAAVMSLLAISVVMFGIKTANAACPSLGTTYGSVTQTFSVASAGTYRVWSRIMVPDTTNNSYTLEVDGSTCGVVAGGSATITPNTWTWVDYQSGTASNKIDLTLTAGNHTIVMYGTKPGVSLDRIIMTTSTTCVPDNTISAGRNPGDNCVTLPDTTPPVVSITSPADGTTVLNSVSVVVSATDAGSGIKSVALYDGSTLLSTQTTGGPTYTFSVDSSAWAAGSTHSITAKATDNASPSNTATSAAVGLVEQSAGPTYQVEDINQDRCIDILDASALGAKFGQTVSLGRTDINGDGIVDILDASALGTKFGTCY